MIAGRQLARISPRIAWDSQNPASWLHLLCGLPRLARAVKQGQLLYSSPELSPTSTATTPARCTFFPELNVHSIANAFSGFAMTQQLRGVISAVSLLLVCLQLAMFLNNQPGGCVRHAFETKR